MARPRKTNPGRAAKKRPLNDDTSKQNQPKERKCKKSKANVLAEQDQNVDVSDQEAQVEDTSSKAVSMSDLAMQHKLLMAQIHNHLSDNRLNSEKQLNLDTAVRTQNSESTNAVPVPLFSSNFVSQAMQKKTVENNASTLIDSLILNQLLQSSQLKMDTGKQALFSTKPKTVVPVLQAQENGSTSSKSVVQATHNEETEDNSSSLVDNVILKELIKRSQLTMDSGQQALSSTKPKTGLPFCQPQENGSSSANSVLQAMQKKKIEDNASTLVDNKILKKLLEGAQLSIDTSKQNICLTKPITQVNLFSRNKNESTSISTEPFPAFCNSNQNYAKNTDDECESSPDEQIDNDTGDISCLTIEDILHECVPLKRAREEIAMLKIDLTKTKNVLKATKANNLKLNDKRVELLSANYKMKKEIDEKNDKIKILETNAREFKNHDENVVKEYKEDIEILKEVINEKNSRIRNLEKSIKKVSEQNDDITHKHEEDVRVLKDIINKKTVQIKSLEKKTKDMSNPTTYSSSNYNRNGGYGKSVYYNKNYRDKYYQ